MKTNEQILLRIADLRDRLAKARGTVKQAQTGADQSIALQKEARLEGNIGALEWTLREGD